jgi:divalent metal cation (Fe/Co/Zn/Cd) transporter
MIALSSALACSVAVVRLVHPRDVTHLWVVAAAAVVGFAGNEIVARYRIRVGNRIGSAALVADGLHARTDGFTSLAVLLGVGGGAEQVGGGPTRWSGCSSPRPSSASYALPSARSAPG